MSERERAARAIGFLEGLSALLWSIGENPDGSISMAAETCGYYDDQVEILRRFAFGEVSDGE